MTPRQKSKRIVELLVELLHWWQNGLEHYAKQGKGPEFIDKWGDRPNEIYLELKRLDPESTERWRVTFLTASSMLSASTASGQQVDVEKAYDMMSPQHFFAHHETTFDRLWRPTVFYSTIAAALYGLWRYFT